MQTNRGVVNFTQNVYLYGTYTLLSIQAIDNLVNINTTYTTNEQLVNME